MAGKNNMRLVVVLVAFVAAFATLVAPTLASTSVQRPFPQGIDQNNAQRAAKQVAARAEVDASYARAIAAAGGSSAYAEANYEVVGYGKVSGGTNSATVTSSGATVGVPDTAVCKEKAKALILKDKKTGNKIEICTGCGNVRLEEGFRYLKKVKWKKGTTLKVNKPFKVKFAEKCPDDRTVSGEVSLRIRGTIRAKAWGTVQGRLTARVQASYRLMVKRGKVKVNCGTLTHPQPIPVSPGVVQQVVVCGNGNQQVGNGNAGSNAGSHCNTTVVPPCTTCGCTSSCPPPPVVENSILITSWTDINDIPVGKSSDNFRIGVYASDAGGSLTIDPGVGGVNACGSTQAATATYVVSLQKGNNDVCVTLFAPQDASATSMTVTATAMLGGKTDRKIQTFPITRPTRP